MGQESFLVLEKESEAGGLCRSTEVDGKPLDIGGGHFLDLKRKEVLELLFQFMPREEWQEHHRVSKIRIRGVEIDHPLEGNLWQLPISDQMDFLESIAKAGCLRGEPKPEAFADWITWKLGECIAREYMLPYNRKIWSMDPNALGTYWLYKLPDVSFRETLQSCLERRMFGALPAHGTFLYPKEHGYGEVWRRMGEALGDRLHLGEGLQKHRPGTADRESPLPGGGHRQLDPLVGVGTGRADPGRCPRTAIGKLVQVPIDVDYCPDTLPSDSHWTYDPDESKSFHRILLRANFCTGRAGIGPKPTPRAPPPSNRRFRHRNEFAYPVNTSGQTRAGRHGPGWAKSHGIAPLGRWGHWEHT